jgi:phosphoribosyl-dephospho-CoA transferase
VTSPFTSSKAAGRHDLVYVGPVGWLALFASRQDLAIEPLAARWPKAEWPAVRRRAMPGEAQGVPLGLPLPLEAGKRRLSFLLPSHDIQAVTRPLSLSSAIGSAPRWWWPSLERLDKLSSRHSIDPKVFGSLAWQALTGLPYLSDRSDLDLIFDVHCDTDLDALAASIAAIETEAPMRLDGELMRDDGAAVNWREFHAGARVLLCKTIDKVGLVDREQFVSGRAPSWVSL